MSGGATNPGATVALFTTIFVGVIILSTVALLLIRRWAFKTDSSGDSGLSLESLRQMYIDGELTQEEYEAARDAIVGVVRDRADRGSRPPTAVAPRDSGDERRAPPGYDLTGDRIPGYPHDDDDDGPIPLADRD